MVVMPPSSSVSTQRRQPSPPGKYWLAIDNLPSSITWQALKDLVRQTVRGAFWTSIVFSDARFQHVARGWARVQLQSDATDMYRYLSQRILDNRRLLVHVWDIRSTSPMLVDCNCGLLGRRCEQRVNAQDMDQLERRAAAERFGQDQRAGPSYTLTNTAQSSGTSSVASSSPGSPASHGLGGRLPARPAIPAQQQTTHENSQEPRYVYRPSGLPVNVSGGQVRVEYRTIMLRNLSPDTTEAHLRGLFRQYGEVVIRISRDGRTSKARGTATVELPSAVGASRAVEQLNGRTFMGRVLQVHVTNDPTPIGPPNTRPSDPDHPVIVDGTNGRRGQ